MNTRRLLIALFSAVILLTASIASLACACCAERGTHINWAGIPKSYQVEILDAMKFGKSAELYMNAAGSDIIKGIASVQSDSDLFDWETLSIVDVYTRNTWRINITTPGGKTGSLVLPRPANMSILRIDMHDKVEANTEITVYKEFQFKGTVRSGSGVFRQGLTRPATYRLIFQGRGNMCDNAEDFNHWHLEVYGAKANYAFFGPMKSAR